MWFLLVSLAFLIAVLCTFAAGGLALTTTLGAINTTAVGVLIFAIVLFGVALFLSAKKSRNSPRRSIEQEEGASTSKLKHASASASTRQAVEQKSAWS